MKIRKNLTEDVLRDRIKAQIERLEKNDLLIYDVAAGFGFNKLFVRINNLHPEYYTIWNENNEGEVANLIKYSSIENVIDWVIKDATSYAPKLYKNKYIKMEEEWSYGDSNINYIDTYIWKDDTLDEMEFNEFMAGLKDFFDENLSDYEYIRLEIAPYEEKEGYYAVVPVFEDIDLGDGEFPAYEILNSRFENDYNISDTSKDMVKTYIKDVLKDIKNVNEDLKKLKTWGFKKVKGTDDFSHRVFKESYSYLDKKGNEKVDLEYSDIHYETDYGPMDWETGTGKKYISTDIDYTYTVDKQDIEEFFVDFLSGKDSVYDSIEDYDEYYKYIDDNFDDLMDKYYDDVLKHFEKYAEEEAYENTDPEDLEYYPDYDD